MGLDDSTIVKIKKQTSSAVCASVFSVIISLVSIIFALEAYAAVIAETACP